MILISLFSKLLEMIFIIRAIEYDKIIERLKNHTFGYNVVIF